MVQLVLQKQHQKESLKDHFWDSALSPQKVYDHLWVVPWWAVFPEQKQGTDNVKLYWALHSWKAETVKKFLFSFVSYSEIRPSVPFPRSLVRLADSWTCLCNSSSLFPFLSEFLFNKYSPYAIACNKIISLIVPLTLSLTEQQEPYNSPEVPLMQHFPYNGDF